jgi:hypothetical protein
VLDRRLTSRVVPVHRLKPELTGRLYDLYRTHYLGTDEARFHADLAEKDWVILLLDFQDQPVGFSTQRLIPTAVGGKPVRALFSGDTIIHPDHWGSQELVRAWCRLAGELKAEAGPEALYWFLISKGHRTYKYLPLFFERFFPRYDSATPTYEQTLIHTLARAKFGPAYRPDSGLLRWDADHDRLRPDLDTAPSRMDNPHVRFFLDRNPDYRAGAELVCLAEISPENMRGAARRELLAGMSPRAAAA